MSYSQLMIGVSFFTSSMVFRFHYLSQVRWAMIRRESNVFLVFSCELLELCKGLVCELLWKLKFCDFIIFFGQDFGHDWSNNVPHQENEGWIICSLPNTSWEGVLGIFWGSKYLQTQGVWGHMHTSSLLTGASEGKKRPLLRTSCLGI